MVKFVLQLCARFEYVKSLSICGDDFRWYFKVRCGNCNWESESPLYLTLDESVEVKGGRSHVSLAMKCHLCHREITIDIHKPTVRPYTATDETFQTVAEFECRGGEPFNFESPKGWVVTSDSDQTFSDVDLATKEWCDYDEELRASIGVYDFRKIIFSKNYFDISVSLSMRLYEKPFNNGFAHAIFLIGSGLKYPQFWIVDKLLSYWRETTAEREWRIHEGPCYERGCIITFSVVFGLLALIVCLPFTIIGYFLWLAALRYRNPFIYTSTCGRSKSGDSGGPLLLAGRNITILSLNTKLLPESRSRTFNLAHVARRAKQIVSIIIHASTVAAGHGKTSGEPSCAGKSSFMTGGPHGDSISQVSYGYLEKSAAYGDNISENRSLVSGTAVDVAISGIGQPSVGTGTGVVANGESYSLGAGAVAGSQVATDQLTIASLRSVEGMWQRRAANKDKSESCITLKSDVPIKQLTLSGLPGSSHTLESLNSESRSRFSEGANPSTMSVSSRVHGIPALALANNIHNQNGSVVVAAGNGTASGAEQQRQPARIVGSSAPQPSGSVSQPVNQAFSEAQGSERGTGEVESQVIEPSIASGAGLLGVQPVGSSGPSAHGGSVDVAAAQADVPSLSGGITGVGFSSVVHLPSDCPSAEIVCLQEVADARAASIVPSLLLSAYPHVLHSAKRYHGFRSCPVTVGNLVIASKFPILCARYHEQLTAFGKRSLLVCKLLLQHAGDQRIVAIVGNVYMKRNSPLTLLEPADFDELVKWLRSFRTDAISSDVNDILSLDICAGYIDLPEDGALVHELFQHEFFMSYISPAMQISAGDSLFGAELQPTVLHDAEVAQPESLHQTLFRYHPNGPRLSQLFRRLSDVAGETAPFSLLRSSFLRYCRDTTEQQQQQHRTLQSQTSSSRGGITTAFAGLTTHLGLNASFHQC